MGCNDCIRCMSRVPYATLIATVMCCVGVGVFCSTLYKGVRLTLHMLTEVFHNEIVWLDPIRLIFIIIGAIMGGLGLLLMVVGFLATGSTREKVYKHWKAQLGGRISCAILMIITYILNLVWMMMFISLIIVTLGFGLAWGLCNKRPTPNEDIAHRCIDLTQFSFLFPNTTQKDSLNVCGALRYKQFCKEGVEPAGVMFVLATIAAFLVILSLVHYLMCLAANYAHIKNNKNLEELHLYELQYLHETEA